LKALIGANFRQPASADLEKQGSESKKHSECAVPHAWFSGGKLQGWSNPYT